MISEQHTNLILNIKSDAYFIVKKLIYVSIGYALLHSSLSLAGSIPPPPPCAPPAAPTITASQKPCEPNSYKHASSEKLKLDNDSELIKMLSDYITSQNKHHS